MQSQTTYAREILRRTKETTQLLQQWRLYSGIGTAILSPLVRLMVGRMSDVATTVIESIASGIIVYVVLTMGEFGYKALFAIPAEIWSENRKSIAALEHTLKELTEGSWPSSFKPETRQSLIDLVQRERATFSLFSIYYDPQSNCADFALALDEVLKRAGWRSNQLSPVAPKRPIRPGIRILGPDPAAGTLKEALKTVLGIDAERGASTGEVQIQIGKRRGAT